MPAHSPPVPGRRMSGSRSACELRISGQSRPVSRGEQRQPAKSASASALPPIELRGLRAFRPPPAAASSASGSAAADSQAAMRDSGRAGCDSAAAHAAAAVLLPISPSRSFRASSHSEEDMGDSSGDDVSQFTASSCSTVRGYGYQRSDTSQKSSARGPVIGGHRARRKRRRSEPEEGAVCCPRGHELVHSERHKPWFCHGCGRVSSTCQMECFRCNRCNYNLCDQCFNAQVEEELAPPPLWPRPQSQGGTSAAPSSIPQSVEEFLARAHEDVSLPRIPPAFSRGLSPTNFSPRSTANSSNFDYRNAPSAASTCNSWRNSSGGKFGKMGRGSKSPSPTRLDENSSAATWRSASQSRRSSRRSSFASSVTSTRQHDPMLRIVSLSEWMAESGIFGESLADYETSTRNGTDPRAAVSDLADIMVKGMSFGKPGQKASRLDKAALEQLHMMSRCRFLPLEDVHEDLKIWHLTLLRRPSRRKMPVEYGRVLQREGGGPGDIDPELLARMPREDGSLTPRRGSALASGAAGTYGLSADDGFGAGGRGYGQGGAGAGGYAAGGLGPDGLPRYGAEDGSMGPDGKSRSGDRFGTALPGEEGQLGPDGKPLYDQKGRRIGKDGKPIDADGNPIEDDDFDGNENGGDEDPDAARLREKEGGDASGKQGGRQRASLRSSGGQSGPPGGKDELGEFHDGVRANEVPEPTEEELALAAGQLFKIKKIAEQVILDEFANMLLPPPPLSSVTGKNSSRTGGQDAGFRSRRSVVSQAPVIFSSGMKSNLADDFRKVIEEAFRLIEFPDETKKKNALAETADVEDFLKEEVLDPEIEKLLSRSATVNLKSDSSLLETHLRMRAERHGRRLQSKGDKLGKTHGNEGLWPRRLQCCRQSLRSIAALDAFAEMRARQKLATA